MHFRGFFEFLQSKRPHEAWDDLFFCGEYFWGNIHWEKLKFFLSFWEGGEEAIQSFDGILKTNFRDFCEAALENDAIDKFLPDWFDQ